MKNNFILENNEVYSIVFPSRVRFKFRILSLRETEYFSKILEGGIEPPFFIYEEIFDACYLGRPALLRENIKAGYIISIGRLILYLSRDEDKEKLLFDIAAIRKVNPVDSIYEHMRAVVLMAFKSYTLRDLKGLTRNEFIELFVVAENALTKSMPDFLRLDLEKIYNDSNESKKETPKGRKIFKAENEELERALGAFKIEEARELEREEKKQVLSKKQLAKLDRARRQ